MVIQFKHWTDVSPPYKDARVSTLTNCYLFLLEEITNSFQDAVLGNSS